MSRFRCFDDAALALVFADVNADGQRELVLLVDDTLMVHGSDGASGLGGPSVNPDDPRRCDPRPWPGRCGHDAAPRAGLEFYNLEATRWPVPSSGDGVATPIAAYMADGMPHNLRSSRITSWTLVE